MRRLALPCIVASSLLIVGCGPPALGEELAIDALCKPENNDKRVSVAGHFSAAGLLTMCSTMGDKQTCSFKITKTADAEEPAVTVSFVMGDGENQMAPLPEEFKREDIKIKALGGKIVGDRAHIKVTGRALIDEGSCQILDAERIDAM